MAMIELTPARRLEIYEAMLNYINIELISYGKYPYGFCYALNFCRSNICYELDAYKEDTIQRHFPELYAYKPEKPECYYLNYWFDVDKAGTAKRIHILNEIISKMKSL